MINNKFGVDPKDLSYEEIYERFGYTQDERLKPHIRIVDHGITDRLEIQMKSFGRPVYFELPKDKVEKERIVKDITPILSDLTSRILHIVVINKNKTLKSIELEEFTDILHDIYITVMGIKHYSLDKRDIKNIILSLIESVFDHVNLKIKIGGVKIPSFLVKFLFKNNILSAVRRILDKVLA